ncbi:MAG TPA: NAD(P)H-dependent oxidoreductase [Balneolales bacterium]|nr:NAD(P)H-dependent oxidoreductase [Balneolales bacterium]
MITLKIISSTDRPGANALKVSEYLRPKYESLGSEVEVISMRDFPIEEVGGGRYGKSIPLVDNFNKNILDTDGLIFVIPEYNGSFPGILKLFFDYLPYPNGLEKMPVCMVGESSGAFGALRAVEQFETVCGYRKAYVFPERVFIARVNQNFDKEAGIRDSFTQSLLLDQIHNFYSFVRNVKNHDLSPEEARSGGWSEI